MAKETNHQFFQTKKELNNNNNIIVLMYVTCGSKLCKQCSGVRWNYSEESTPLIVLPRGGWLGSDLGQSQAQ